MTDEPRSARGHRFAIATPHVEATAAGVAAFDAGGNAVDAALAAATTLAVVAPSMCGVGGDLIALVREPTGRVVALNAAGAAPRGVDVGALRREHGTMPEHGPHAVTVPGVVSGWWELARRWSVRGFAAAFERALPLARDGVPVSRTLAEDLRSDADRLLADPGLTAVFTDGGRPLERGETLRQPALGRSLELLVDQGPPAMYGGVLGESIAGHLAGLGSAMSVDDLAAHQPELAVPLSHAYRELEVFVAPPPSQGFVLLQALAVIERLGIDPDPIGPDAGVIAEVFRLVSIDRDHHNADPRHTPVPVASLLDGPHLDELAERVRRPDGGVAVRRASDTIALVAADDSGLAVSLVQSLYDAFGSGILEPSTGVVLHCRGAAFVLDPAHPNVLAGGKRPAHTLLPVVVHRDGRLAAVAGTMGGGSQPQIDAMTLTRAFDLGWDPAAAVAGPRWLVGGMSLGSEGRALVAEASVPPDALDAFGAAGFAVQTLGQFDGAVGHAHLLLARDDGLLEAGTDPRADGAAAAR